MGLPYLSNCIFLDAYWFANFDCITRFCREFSRVPTLGSRTATEPLAKSELRSKRLSIIAAFSHHSALCINERTSFSLHLHLMPSKAGKRCAWDSETLADAGWDLLNLGGRFTRPWQLTHTGAGLCWTPRLRLAYWSCRSPMRYHATAVKIRTSPSLAMYGVTLSQC